MRVAALLHLYGPDHLAGAETMIHSMLVALAKRGHEVDVYLTLAGAFLLPYHLDGVKVWPKSSWSQGDIQADVVISHLENIPRAGSLALALRAPYIQVVHNTYLQSKAHAEVGADLVVVNSEWMKADLAELVRSEMIIVRPLPDPEQYRTTPGENVTLVNLYMNKGGELFWRLASLMPRVQFLAVEGAYGHQEKLGPLPNVEVWPHAQRSMLEVFGQTKVLIMPSAYESWGRVGTEAICSGIPVVAHPTLGLKESLGDAGIFINRYNMRAWCAAIDELVNVPAAWSDASARALARSAQLDPAADMAAWCDRVESLRVRVAA